MGRIDLARESFPRQLRLRRRADYLGVQGSGRKVQTDHLLLLWQPTPSPAQTRTRVGITVSSRVGNAVVRNRIKRWIREFVRRQMRELPEGDVVFIAKASAATCAHPVLDRDLARLVARAARR